MKRLTTLVLPLALAVAGYVVVTYVLSERSTESPPKVIIKVLKERIPQPEVLDDSPSAERNLTARQYALLEAIGGQRGDDADGTPVCGASEKKRWYATSDRKDFTAFVSEELYELGLCAWRHRKRGFDIYIGEQFESLRSSKDGRQKMYTSPHIRKGAVVTSVPGLMDVVGTKKAFASLFLDCLKSKTRLCKEAMRTWLPPSFNVDSTDGYSHFVVRHYILSDILRLSSRLDFDHAGDFLPTPRAEEVHHKLAAKKKKMTTHEGVTHWIVKRQNGTYLSKGIHLARLDPEKVGTDDRDLKEWLFRNFAPPQCRAKRRHHAKTTDCVGRVVSFQRYVDDPLLAFGRKFDLRFLIVIASIDPLRLYLMRHAYPKISSRTWAENPKGRLNDENLATSDPTTVAEIQCTHVQMMLAGICNQTVGKFKQSFPSGYPETTAAPSFAQGFEGMPPDWFSAVAWPQLERAVTQLVILIRRRLRDAETNMFSESENDKRYRRVGILSVDAIIEASGRVVLEEVNTNGIIMGTHGNHGGARELFRDDDYTRGMLRLIGADGYPKRRNYQAQLSEVLDRYCRGLNVTALRCSTAARDAIRHAVDEEAHAGPHWYRLYPPLRNFAQSSQRRGTFWPDQFHLREADYRDLHESSLERIVRLFLETTPTSPIHGIPQVPGHARWHQRGSFEEESTAANRYLRLMEARLQRKNSNPERR